MNRDSIIIRTSVIGIIANLFLVVFKAAVGFFTHSIAITLDAVNNLSDALSSVITIVGTHLSGKPADKDHPYGHGRAEFISAFIISIIVLYAGATSLFESVKKIINPDVPDYSPAALVIVSVAILVKIVLGMYVKKSGEKVNSASLVDSGKDALLDAVISLTTLIAAGIFIIFGISTEPYLGAIISLVIIKSGYEMISEAISTILGERVDSKLTREIKRFVCENSDVYGAYDLILHNYGPDRLMGSIHVEVDENLSASQIDVLTRDIAKKVYEEFGILMVAVGIYSRNTSDAYALEAQDFCTVTALEHPEVLQLHGFYLNKNDHTMSFDIVMSFDAKDDDKILEDIRSSIKKQYPKYDLQIQIDADISD
ncbi:MAG: cation diffusion facilitator family transporter [Lachnospiraceae bacterium]|nr:cation diffusion facilitator family transporter [Lachnospiraceae bacterium]